MHNTLSAALTIIKQFLSMPGMAGPIQPCGCIFLCQGIKPSKRTSHIISRFYRFCRKYKYLLQSKRYRLRKKIIIVAGPGYLQKRFRNIQFLFSSVPQYNKFTVIFAGLIPVNAIFIIRMLFIGNFDFPEPFFHSDGIAGTKKCSMFR